MLLATAAMQLGMSTCSCPFSALGEEKTDAVAWCSPSTGDSHSPFLS
jgi:hypothetical protein